MIRSVRGGGGRGEGYQFFNERKRRGGGEGDGKRR